MRQSLALCPDLGLQAKLRRRPGQQLPLDLRCHIAIAKMSAKTAVTVINRAVSDRERAPPRNACGSVCSKALPRVATKAYLIRVARSIINPSRCQFSIYRCDL